MEVRYSNIVQPIPVKNRADLSVNPAQNSDVAETSIKSNPVSFQGVPNTILRRTVNNIDEIYALYKTSLEEVPLKSVIETAENLASTTGHDKKEVLSAMYHLTNFSNIRSVMYIANVLERDNIGRICNNKLVFNKEDFSESACSIMNGNSGLHKTLEYMIEYKGFGNLNNFGSKKTAFFLDKKNIELLERLKRECPDDFLKLKNNKDMKFYYLSGWDSGITFIDRTKKLGEQTKKLFQASDKTGLPVEVAADKPFLDRIHQLGLSPKVISQAGLPTEVCIYKRMAPEQMTKSELTNLIIANSELRSKNVSHRLKKQDEASEYVKNNLKVFTPESLSSMSVLLNTKVNNFAKVKGIKPENILYIEPDVLKSNSLISYMYKTVNNIPDEQFITFSDLKNKDKKFLDGKLAVFLDDCSITGSSIKEQIFMDFDDISQDVPKLFVCYGATANAKRAIGTAKNKEKNIHIIIGDYIPHVLTNKYHITNRKTEGVVGRPNYIQGEATCLIFPYMSPDTNTELASNIALLHNTNYRLSNIMVPYKHRDYRYKATDEKAFQTLKSYKHIGVKSYTPFADKVAKKANSMAGSTPTVVKSNPIPEKESFIDKILKLIK